MRLPILLATASILLVLACGSTPSGSDSEPPPGDAMGTGPGNGSGPGVLDPGKSNPPNQAPVDCSDAAKLVYVISAERTLYSFAPDKLLFSKVGTIDCPALRVPGSMAIDRSGTAWVANTDDGKLFKVSTTDASCQATMVETGGHWGMAFTTESATSQVETLYLGEKGPPLGSKDGTYLTRFAKLDLATMKLSVIGEFSGTVLGIGAELTGTGDGRLFGYFGTASPAILAQIDRTTSQTMAERRLAELQNVSALQFAFAFWGGDFWFFGSDDQAAGRRSNVSRMRTSGDGSLSRVLADVGGFHIVGAGVSTCAPITPPVVR